LNNAARPISELSAERILKSQRRVLKGGQSLKTAQNMHRLRIDCKKLRYLLEFFRSLYPANDIGTLIQTLKQLQDCLGDYNDYCVQQESLRWFYQEIVRLGLAGPRTGEAVDHIIQQLAKERRKKRREFSRWFSAFSSDKNKALCQRLFVKSS